MMAIDSFCSLRRWFCATQVGAMFVRSWKTGFAQVAHRLARKAIVKVFCSENAFTFWTFSKRFSLFLYKSSGSLHSYQCSVRTVPWNYINVSDINSLSGMSVQFTSVFWHSTWIHSGTCTVGFSILSKDLSSFRGQS